MLISIFKFVIGAVVTILLITVVWHFFGPEEKAEASTLKSMDDIIVKLSKIKEGQTVIAYGYVDKDAAIVGFSSEQLKVDDFNRPKQCGARSNSCICAFKGNDKVLECKGFQSGRISDIVGKDGGQLNIKGEKSFTLKMTLSGVTLTTEELT